MKFIIRQLREARRQPPRKLRDLGAEYFINAAQQARLHSPELAVRLLAVAQEINPDSDSLAQRLRQWREEHFMEPDFDQDAAGAEPTAPAETPAVQTGPAGNGSSGKVNDASASASRK
jgi:hypothetical protein